MVKRKPIHLGETTPREAPATAHGGDYSSLPPIRLSAFRPSGSRYGKVPKSAGILIRRYPLYEAADSEIFSETGTVLKTHPGSQDSRGF